MESETLDLDINGHSIRVVCGDVNATASLRSRLHDHVVTTPNPVGFYIQAPSAGANLYAVLDRSGIVLGRTRDAAQACQILLGHLAVFLPVPPGTVRMRARALLAEDSRVVFAGWPLFTVPSLIERRLQRTPYRMIDRLAVDLTTDGQMVVPSSPWVDPSVDVPGHALECTDADTQAISSVLLPYGGGGVQSKASNISTITAAAMVVGKRETILDIAEHLTTDPVTQVDPSKTMASYQALSEEH